MEATHERVRAVDAQERHEPLPAPRRSQPEPVSELIALQRQAGNTVVNRLLVGAADDHAESDAERAAQRAVGALFGDPSRPDAADELNAASGIRRSARTSTGVIGAAGGELDTASSTQLAGRLGRGRPLHPEISSTFALALGADVSRARIHDDALADSLARRMSATAFTVGDDIFFSKDSYQPEHPGGARLLAHELAHVAQHAHGAQRSLVHRAIGFEFETNVVVHKRTTKFLGLGTKYVPLEKLEVIQAYPTEGVSMEADENSGYGSTIEFVTRPQIEENNRAGLVAALDKIRTITDQIALAPVPTDGTDAYTPREPLENHVNTVTRQDVVFFPRANNITANPQATVGVAVTKMSGLLRQIKTDVSEGAQAMADTHNPAYANRAAANPDLADKPGLQGLVALLAAYIARGSTSAGNQPLNYAKLISGSVMVRTDFGSYFGKLSDAERNWALGGDGARGERLLTAVLDAASKAGEGNRLVFERGVRKSQKQDRQGRRSNKRLDLRELQITRKNWVLGIANGHDDLAAYFARAKAKEQLEGLGRLGPAFDKVGAEVGQQGQGSGAIVELREMKKNVDHTEWKDLALSIFDHMVAMHAPAQQPAQQEEQQGEEREEQGEEELVMMV